MYLSGIVVNAESFLENINTIICEMFRKISYGFIDNRYVQKIHLYKNNLHLVEHGKCGLTRNFIHNFNFLNTAHCGSNIHMHKPL